MEELVIVLLKLLVQLVLYAFTGKWHRFGETNDPATPPPSPVKPWPRTRGRSTKKPLALPDLSDPRAVREALRRALEARLRSAPSDGEEAPWFTFPDEYVEPEPADEAVGGEVASQLTALAQKPMRAQLPAVPVRGAPRSIRRAVRDRQTLRYAVVLGSALGPRGPRR